MMQMITDRRIVGLLLAVSFIMVCLFGVYHEVNTSNVKAYSSFLFLGIVFVMIMLYFYLLNGKRATGIVIVLIALICAYELFFGILQFFGLYAHIFREYVITGSFRNPGPYGGFLAVCLSLLAAFVFKNRDSYKEKFTSSLLYWVVSVIAVVAFIILPSTQSRSSIIALGCSMILLSFGTKTIRDKISPILKRYGLWMVLGVAMLGTGAYLLKKPSADGRLFMDKICIKTMFENGLRGAGLGHFGAAYGETQARYFKTQITQKGRDDLDWNAIDEHERMISDCPENAFNEYLFIGVEAGPIAMLLFITVIVTAIVISFKEGTIWCYGLTTLAIFALFSYPLHVMQLQLLFAVLLAACVSDRVYVVRKVIRKKDYYIGLATIMIVVIVYLGTGVCEMLQIKQYYKAENNWRQVDHWHHEQYYEYVVEDSEELMPYMKNDFHFLFAYGQSLNKTGNYEKSDSILMMGTELSCDPMFWNVMGNNSLALGNYREAEERYKKAFYMVPNRIYPLYLLAKLYHSEGDAKKFYLMADKLESFKPKVESVNTERLLSEIIDLKSKYSPKNDDNYNKSRKESDN